MSIPSSQRPSLPPSPAEYAAAAAILMSTVLEVKAGERLIIVADVESEEVGVAIRRAAEAAGAQVSLTRLDLLPNAATGKGERPHKVLPDVLRRGMLGAQVSCFVASAPHHEHSMREQFMHIVRACGIRHCHMAGIKPRGFIRGFKLGYDQVAKWGTGIAKRLELSRTVETTSPAGTHLSVTLSTETRWVSRFGELTAGRSVTLPAGAIYAAPESVSGTFVANASIGEFFGERHGLLLRSPVTLTIENGLVSRVEAPLAPELERDLRAMLAFAPNSARVGLVAVGVNPGIETPSGEAGVDQNYPGLHLIVGDPSGKETGVSWSARTSFPACQSGSRVVVDGVVAIDDGKIVSVL